MNKFFLSISLVLIIIQCACSESPGARVSEYLRYSGYAEAQYKGFVKESRFVAMSDGTNIAVDIFLPKDGPKADKFPVLFIMTPYNRAYLHPALKWYEKLAARITKGTFGPVFDWSTRADIKLFLSHGYAFVIADMRGAGASFGKQTPFTPEVAQDGKEMVDWIGAQPWCSGRVGMMGRSYLGWIQLMVAAKRPKVLACIMPEVIVADGFTEGVRPGGIDAIAWINRYSKLLQDLNQNRLDPDNLSLPVAPVVDEDGDGELADEIPLMKGGGDDGSFLDNGEPVYSDGAKREGVYYKATADHLKNGLFKSFARQFAPFFDTVAPEVFGNNRSVDGSPGYYLKEILAAGIPVYHVGGWFDGFVKGTSKLYASMAGKAAAYLSIAPRFHYPPYINKQYAGLFGYGADYEAELTLERLRFFDYYLKGIRNGFDKGDPVHIFVMNRGWRAEKEWPLARQKMIPFYCAPNGSLSPQKGSGADQYKVDFTHRSNYGKNGVNRWLLMYVPDGLMIRTDLDKKCLTYDTAPLAEDTEVTGHPLVNIWVSSNRDDGDFFVYLADVDESGTSLYVTEGQLRAGWNKLYPDDDQVLGKVNILPDLPWHGYKKNQYAKSPLAGGKSVELRFDMLPTSWLFKKGHRIRIAIACADQGNFEMNPYLCSGDEPGSCPETMVTLHHTEAMPSRVELPVIPPAKR